MNQGTSKDYSSYEEISDIGSNSEADVGSDSEADLDPKADSDSEADKILRDITKLRAEGPAKPKHTKQTIRLWKREGQH